MFFHKRNLLKYLFKDLYVVLGIVLIWRGIMFILDYIDKIFFQGGHVWTALGGIVVGLILLYLPDKDLKEIEKL